MRFLTAVFLLLAGTAYAQSPVFDAISAGNLPLNVKGAPYNAKCDGTVDDTSAIQNAINAGVASGKSFTLLLPAGVCKTSAALTITGGTGQSVAIKGETRATSQLLVTGTGDGIDVTLSQGSSIFTAMLDIRDFTMLATATAGTAIKAVSTVANAVSPKFDNLRIGYTGSGSFANGISTALMSNIVVRGVNINSPNATGIAFQFDGNATFPSITDMFSDIYFWGFATGIQIGNGTTSYVQGVEIANAQLQQNNGACVKWNNQPQGFLGDMLLVSNSFCNGQIVVNNVEDVVVQGTYFLSNGVSQLSITTATSYVASSNTFNAGNAASTNGIVVVNSHGLVVGNNFLNYNATGSAPIIFNSGTQNNFAANNHCNACQPTGPVVNDFGTNWQVNNINEGNAAVGGSTYNNIISRNTAQQTWDWHVPATPTFLSEGSAMGWNYQGQGETDIFLSRGAGGANGYSEVWYDTTSGSVGNQLLGLDINGNLHLSGALTAAGVPVAVQGGLQFGSMVTVSALPTCNAGLKGTFRTVSDAASPAYNAAVAGSGAVAVPVFCNGTAWTAH